MAALLHSRNKLLAAAVRIVGASVSLNTGVAFAFTVPKLSTTTIPGTITVTAEVSRFTSPTYSWWYRFSKDEDFTEIAGVSGYWYNIEGNKDFLDAAVGSSSVQLKVVVSEATQQAEDTITIPILRDGASSVLLQLSNDALVVPSSSAGVVDDATYPMLTSSILVYNGDLDDSSNWTVTLGNIPDGLLAEIVDGNVVRITNISSSFSSGMLEVLADRQGYAQLKKSLSVTKITEGEDAVAYTVEIESTNGTVFRVGERRQTMLIARVFRNGVEVTDELASANFRWWRVSLDPPPPPLESDEAWAIRHKYGFKQVLVDVDDVLSKATFHCEIIQ